MPIPQSLPQYAHSLERDLEAIGLTPPPGFREAFMREARRLGQESAEDLGSAYLLECLKTKCEGSRDSRLASLKTLGTVRRRLVREAQKARRAEEAAVSKERMAGGRD